MSVKEEIDTVKGLVEYFLKTDKRCRNDDKWLTYRVMRTYTDIYIPFEDFKKIPAFATVKRVRAYIQNKENRLLPTNKEVRKKRGIAQEEWREYFAKRKQ